MKKITLIVLLVLLFSINNIYSFGEKEYNKDSGNVNQKYYNFKISDDSDEYKSLIFGTKQSSDKSNRLSQNAVEDIILKHVISNNPDKLYIDEILEFDNNFYIKIGEKNTDYLAFELTMDPFLGYIKPEPGPNILWNTKYGYHHFKKWFTYNIKNMDLSNDQAYKIAKEYLHSYLPDSSLDKEIDKFHGYYTINVRSNNNLIGIISINGYTGEVWFHHKNHKK